MNAPINTSHDDFGFVMEEGGKTGYLSSDRDGGDRIYTFTMYEPTFILDGVVMDDSSRYLPNMVVTLTDLANMQDTSITTGADGHLSFRLKANSDYRLKAERSDMMTSSRAITTRGLSRSDTLHVAFNMQPVIFNKAFALEEIYYDYDKWDLRPESTNALDKVVRVCQENSDLTFELSAHTDSRGSDTYNLVLSDARANSAVNYLIQHGVAPDRITARGYGETLLRNKCSNGIKCTEEEHQANRRTEFKITGIREVANER
jgi:outer membrane protein OmpA-like peptidoglycan-associated protein